MRSSKITPEERASRQEAVDFARASVAMEGFKLSAEEIEHGRRYIDGEIDLEEFVSAPVVVDGKTL